MVPGLERGLRILAEFSPREPVLGAPELSKRLGIPRTTVFRLLQTLESLGFLERADRIATTSSASPCCGSASNTWKPLELTDLGLPVIESLRDATGFTTHIVIRDGRDVVFVAKAQSQAPVFSSIRVNVGTRLPAHATTHGHVLMGDLSLKELHALYPEGALNRMTNATPETVDALYEVIREDALRGYGVSNSSFERGISVVTAPVRNETQKIVACITVTVPRPEIDAALIADGLIDKVQRAAAELSRRLNYRSDDEHTFLKALGLK